MHLGEVLVSQLIVVLLVIREVLAVQANVPRTVAQRILIPEA